MDTPLSGKTAPTNARRWRQELGPQAFFITTRHRKKQMRLF